MKNIQEHLFKVGILPLVDPASFEAECLGNALQQSGVWAVVLKESPTAEWFEKFKQTAPCVEIGCLPEGVAAFPRKELLSFVWKTTPIPQSGLPVISPEMIPGGVFELSPIADFSVLCRELKKRIYQYLNFNLRHVGINSRDEQESCRTVETFEALFGFPKEDRGGAYFAGEIIEVMKMPFYGTHGHIALSTENAPAAAHYLEQAGVSFNWKSAGYNPDGRLRVVYLQEEIGGFAVHILQK